MAVNCSTMLRAVVTCYSRSGSCYCTWPSAPSGAASGMAAAASHFADEHARGPCDAGAADHANMQSQRSWLQPLLGIQVL